MDPITPPNQTNQTNPSRDGPIDPHVKGTPATPSTMTNDSLTSITKHSSSVFPFTSNSPPNLTDAQQYYSNNLDFLNDLFSNIAQENIQEVINIIKQHPRVINVYHEGNTPLNIAIKTNNYELVKALIEAKADTGLADLNKWLTPVHLAAASNNSNIMEALLETKRGQSCLNVRLQISMNHPLHIAAYNNTSAAEKITDLLIQYRADINPKNERGYTPLEVAVEQNNAPVVISLLKERDIPRPCANVMKKILQGLLNSNEVVMPIKALLEEEIYKQRPKNQTPTEELSQEQS